MGQKRAYGYCALLVFCSLSWSLRRCLGHTGLLCESAEVLLPLLYGGCLSCGGALQIHREEERPNEKPGDPSGNILRNFDALRAWQFGRNQSDLLTLCSCFVLITHG
jgi:hypothetical protein